MMSWGSTVRSVTEWHVRSQQVARRNALVGATALAERRRQQADVEEFLEAYLARRTVEVSVRPA